MIKEQCESLYNRIIQRCEQKIIIRLAECLKTHLDLNDETTVEDISDLTNWLYIIDEQDLAIDTANFIVNIQFEGDFHIWENVQSVLTVKALIYEERGDFEKADECIAPIRKVRNSGDEAMIRKRERILQRILNGSLLYDKEIIEAHRKGDNQGEFWHRFLQLHRLCYMKIMGGSVSYPIDFLSKEIAKEKQILKENCKIVNF